jgi:predicted hotdog family 3-hydroxylacyl-ACP dehydratase
MKTTMVALLIAIAALVGIALLVRKRITTTTTATTAKPTGTGSAPVKHASGENITALNWLDTSDNAAALARMQADPSDQEWFDVIDAYGNPTGNITLETLAQATAGASAAATKVNTDNAARLAQIVALNKLSAQVGMQPLATTATDQQVATYRAQYLNNSNLPSNQSTTSLGWLGAGLNAIGSAIGVPKLGTAIQGAASLST